MARLYAEIDSDKGGRVVSKGGGRELRITAHIGNAFLGTLHILATGRVTWNNAKGEIKTIEAGEHGECWEAHHMGAYDGQCWRCRPQEY